MYTKGDFHMHTTISDGDYTPTELVSIAKNAGVDIISITDHNKIDGIKEGILAGDSLGVRVIPGVEISCRYKGVKTHVLGYFTTDILTNDLFINTLFYIKKSDFENANSNLLYYINLQEDKVKKKISVKSAIDFIHYFNGVAILAHPIKLPFEIFNELILLNFDGIEGKYFKNSQVDTNFFLDICRQKNFIYTAGSDFHTDKKDDKRHGILGEVFLNTVEITSFLNLLQNKSERK